MAELRINMIRAAFIYIKDTKKLKTMCVIYIQWPMPAFCKFKASLGYIASSRLIRLLSGMVLTSVELLDLRVSCRLETVPGIGYT